MGSLRNLKKVLSSSHTKQTKLPHSLWWTEGRISNSENPEVNTWPFFFFIEAKVYLALHFKRVMIQNRGDSMVAGGRHDG